MRVLSCSVVCELVCVCVASHLCAQAYIIASALRVSWHDTQLLIRGPATQHFHLHFLQRWNHAFTRDISHTRGVALTLPSPVPVVRFRATHTHSHAPQAPDRPTHTYTLPTYPHR